MRKKREGLDLTKEEKDFATKVKALGAAVVLSSYAPSTVSVQVTRGGLRPLINRISSQS